MILSAAATWSSAKDGAETRKKKSSMGIIVVIFLVGVGGSIFWADPGL